MRSAVCVFCDINFGLFKPFGLAGWCINLLAHDARGLIGVEPFGVQHDKPKIIAGLYQGIKSPIPKG